MVNFFLGGGTLPLLNSTMTYITIEKESFKEAYDEAVSLGFSKFVYKERVFMTIIAESLLMAIDKLQAEAISHGFEE